MSLASPRPSAASVFRDPPVPQGGMNLTSRKFDKTPGLLLPSRTGEANFSPFVQQLYTLEEATSIFGRVNVRRAAQGSNVPSRSAGAPPPHPEVDVPRAMARSTARSAVLRATQPGTGNP